jgi:DNA primase
MEELDVNYEPIADLLIEIFGDYKFHNDIAGQIAFSCPVCSFEIKGLDHLDGKGNLEVNYKLGVYKCWACSETHNTRGRLYHLVKKYGSRRHLKDFTTLMPETPGEIGRKTYKKVRLPKEFTSFVRASEGLKMTPIYKVPYNYVRGRNITDEMIKKFNIGFCYNGDYKNRIIIPSYDRDGDLNYFIARSWEKSPYLKYKNPEAEKDSLIFNEFLIDWSKPISLVEGAFDSIFVDNSIPMLGKKMSDYLFDTLYENAKEVRIILDGDAWNDAVEIYHQLNGGKLFGKIWIHKLPEESDIAELRGDLSQFPSFQID